MSHTLLTLVDLRKRGIKLSNTTMLRMEAKEAFPKRRYLTPRTVVWCQTEIDAFLAELIGEAGEVE